MITLINLFSWLLQVQAGISGPMPGQNGMPGPAMIQAQPILSTVRTQPQVILN